MRAFSLQVFRDKYYNLVKEVLGEDVCDDQLEYLQGTEMPKGIVGNQWIDRIEVLVSGLVLLKKELKRRKK